MKAVILFSTALLVSFSLSTYGQSPQLRAEIKVIDISRVCPDPCPGGTDEVNVIMQANLYANGVLVTNISGLTYDWWRKDDCTQLDCHQSWYLRESFVGYNQSGTHTFQDEADRYGSLFDYYVIIRGYGGNPASSVQSPAITIPWHKSTLDQRRQNNSTYGAVKYYDGSQFVSSGTLPSALYSPRGQVVVLLGDINLTADRTEKYHHWTDGQTTYWENYSYFFPPSVFNSYTAQFQPTFPATIQAQLDRRTKLWLKG